MRFFYDKVLHRANAGGGMRLKESINSEEQQSEKGIYYSQYGHCSAGSLSGVA
jgi:hypothetical protein